MERKFISPEQSSILFRLGFFLFFAFLSYWGHLNLRICSGWNSPGICFQPLHIWVFLFVCIAVLILIFLLLKLKSGKSFRSLFQWSFSIGLALLFLLFFYLCLKITFSGYDEDLPNKVKIYEFAIRDLHMCPLQKEGFGLDVERDCYRWWAAHFGTTAFCNRMSGIDDDLCYADAAKMREDPNICFDLPESTMYQYCLEPYIQATDDKTVCQYASNYTRNNKDSIERFKTDRGRCYFTYVITNDGQCTEYGQSPDDCNFWLAMTLNESVRCQQIQNETQKNDCNYFFGTSTSDPDSCLLIEDEYLQEECLYNSFSWPVECEDEGLLGDACKYKQSIRNIFASQPTEELVKDCAQIADDKYRNRCYFYTAVGEKQETICDNIDAEVRLHSSIHIDLHYQDKTGIYGTKYVNETSIEDCKMAVLHNRRTAWIAPHWLFEMILDGEIK